MFGVLTTGCPAIEISSQRRSIPKRRRGARSSKAHKPPSPGEEFAAGNFILNPAAESPRQKFNVLIEGEPRFAAAWEHRRSDFQDQSQSVYDMSLAYHAALCGWSDQEMVDLLIAHRRKHGADLKLRRDYYKLTISKARKSAAEFWKDADPDELLEAATVVDSCPPELHNNMTSEATGSPENVEGKCRPRS